MIDYEFELETLLGDVDWDFRDSKSESIHSIHPYPAKFISEIPKTLIENLSIPNNSIILDPFCGSGVTLLEAQRKGIPSVGVDLNPVACLLSRVKTRPLPENFLITAEKIVASCQKKKGKVEVPEIPHLDHWFKKDIQETLAKLTKNIRQIQDSSMLDALNFCVSCIVVRVSNQESDTRYAAIPKDYTGSDVYSLFLLAAAKLQKAKSTYISNANVTVLNKNSLELSKDDFPGKVGLVITSPPYPNAYEYWLYHKYRMWWLGHDPLKVKNDEIGARAHYFKKNHQTELDFVLQMDTLFSNLKSVCCKNAYVCFVIGRSKIHGRIIKNEAIIKEAGEKHGLKHITTVSRKIKSNRKSFNLSHARIKDEFIVILQK